MKAQQIKARARVQVRARPKHLNSPNRPVLEASPLKQPLLGEFHGPPVVLPCVEGSSGDRTPDTLICKLLTIEQELEMLVFEQVGCQLVPSFVGLLNTWRNVL